MDVDPFGLDQTIFAQVIKTINDYPPTKELPEEPPHPLRNHPAIDVLCRHLIETEDQLFHLRYRRGEVANDAYFCFNEGLSLRPEIIIKIILDYLRQNPSLIT